MFILKALPEARILVQNNTHQLARKFSAYIERRPWNYIWQPGPYPKTDAQRIAAAKKYGLDISEYTPIEDLGYGHGDYPSLPMIGDALKDNYYPYDFPENKRNFHEPINEEKELLCESKYDYGNPHRIRPYIQWLQFIVVTSFFLTLQYIGEFAPMFHSVIPKQYPGEGKVHYTFGLNKKVHDFTDDIELLPED